MRLQILFSKKTQRRKPVMALPENPSQSQQQSDQAGSSRNRRINQIAPFQVERTIPRPHRVTALLLPPPEAKLSAILFMVLFFLHFFLAASGIFYLLPLAVSRDEFRPLVWLPPLITAVSVAAVFSFIWQLFFFYRPGLLLRSTFYLSSFLTFALGLILLIPSTTSGNVLGGVALIFAISESLYACWVSPRKPHTAEIFRQSIAACPDSTNGIIVTTAITLFTAEILSCFWFSGAVAAISINRTILLLPLMIHLSWTMLVLRNILHVTAARMVYLNLTYDMIDEPLKMYTRIVLTPVLLGSVCLGSILAPVLGLVRDFARGMILLAGGRDEFMFSCASCYSGVADSLFRVGNVWGLVHVGAHNMGFSHASRSTWEAFERLGMVKLIDSDLTSTVSLLSGVACGAFCAIVSGSWMLATHRRDTPAASFFAFVLGYFINRIAMAWSQGCVNAYYVVYAENPQNMCFDSTIPERINDLQD